MYFQLNGNHLSTWIITMPKISRTLPLAENSTLAKTHIPFCSIWPKFVSLAYGCKVIFIITHLCMIINKLINVSVNILYNLLDSISSMINPINLLLHRIYIIFHLIGQPSPKFKLLVKSSHSVFFNIWCHKLVIFRHI